MAAKTEPTVAAVIARLEGTIREHSERRAEQLRLGRDVEAAYSAGMVSQAQTTLEMLGVQR